jgi:phage tail sheath protein FI
MAVQTSFPGVYIDEFAPGAPIEGVGTSTAAFVGAATSGPIREATKITSWDQFVQTFGDAPVAGRYLYYAVRGFFENGGQTCYVVRASNASYAQWDILHRAPGSRPIFRVRARATGPNGADGGAAMTVTGPSVAARNLLTAANTALYQPSSDFAGFAGRDLTMAAAGAVPADQVAGRYRPGDVITLGAANPRLEVMSVAGATLRLADPVAGAPVAGTDKVRLADKLATDRTIRVLSTVPVPSGALVSGTILTLTQGGTSRTNVVAAVSQEFLPEGVTTYRITLQNDLGFAFSQNPATAVTIQSEEFALQLTQGGAPVTYDNLSVEPAHPRYAPRIVNGTPGAAITLTASVPPPTAGLPERLPVAGNLGGFVNGAAENLAALADSDYIDAIRVLRPVDDVNLLSVPDTFTPAVQQEMIGHCELLGDRFAVLDSDRNLPLFGGGSIETQRAGVSSSRGYAGLYYPWIQVRPAGKGEPLLVPPSGHVAGIMARSDNSKGVHKAPANEFVNGALGVERTMTDSEQGQLNLLGINVVRVFNGGRPILWGARTTATTVDNNWMYVNVRRLMLYLEESIQEGIRWAVFEPNNPALWKKLRRSITAFLMRSYRDGAFGGDKPENSFYVRIDETINPEGERRVGRLYIEIGIRPAYPAEFIIVRIGIWEGGSELAET